MRIDRNYCDAILVGDGSGSKREYPGGWAVSVLQFDRETQRANKGELLVGGITQSPINFLESSAYWYALRHLHYNEEWRKRVSVQTPVYIHIITDSEWTAKSMSMAQGGKMHRDILEMYRLYSSWGYCLYWYHMKRERILLNQLADLHSAECREYMCMIEHVNPLELFPDG